MNIIDLLIGKKVKVMTDMKIEVELEIKSIKQNNHSVELEPSTQSNDWWPECKTWTTYTVTFTNDAHKNYNSLENIKII